MENYLSIAAGVISAITISAVTSWITVRLANKQFFSQKWWERKATTYNEIVNALYGSYAAYESDIEDLSPPFGQNKTEEFNNELTKASQEGKKAIERVISIGHFIIDDEAVKTLEDLQKATYGGEEDYIKWLVRGRDEYKKAIDKIIKIGKKDLNV